MKREDLITHLEDMIATLKKNKHIEGVDFLVWDGDDNWEAKNIELNIYDNNLDFEMILSPNFHVSKK